MLARWINATAPARNNNRATDRHDNVIQILSNTLSVGLYPKMTNITTCPRKTGTMSSCTVEASSLRDSISFWNNR